MRTNTHSAYLAGQHLHVEERHPEAECREVMSEVDGGDMTVVDLRVWGPLGVPQMFSASAKTSNKSNETQHYTTVIRQLFNDC